MTNDYLLKTIKNVRVLLEKGVLRVTTDEGYFDTNSRFRVAGSIRRLADRAEDAPNAPVCGACALGALLLGQPREPDEKPFDWEDLNHLSDVTGVRMYLKGLNLLPGTLDKMELMFMAPEAVSSRKCLASYLHNLPTLRELTPDETRPYEAYFPEDCPPRVRLEVLLMQLEQTGTVSVDKPWNSYIAAGLCGRKLLRWLSKLWRILGGQSPRRVSG